MPNHYFKFRQFKIDQDKCAMKVCTDACLFGALVANSMLSSSTTNNDLQCLDIGTGTGLLSLMIAQKNQAIKTDAIEIDKSAAEQAGENIAASPWADRIQVFNEDILHFMPGKQYDYIFSNPPFFENDLKTAVDAKNKARHDTSMSLLDLLSVAVNLLAPAGTFAVLLPWSRVAYFTAAAKKTGLHLSQQVLVKQSGKHDFFRGILFLKREETETMYSEIIIKDADQMYTPAFAEALKDYYLFL
jgi:tRNA1Val (adenine37-N6)-methyltransferase